MIVPFTSGCARFFVLLASVFSAIMTPLPARQGTRNAYPGQIISAPDGNLWFTEDGGIGRITPQGVFSTIPLPHVESGYTMTLGKDGALWLTETHGIGRLTLQRHLTQYALPKGDGQPDAITQGPDGTIWFTEATMTAHSNGTYDEYAVARITTSGRIAHVHPKRPIYPLVILAGPDGNLWFAAAHGLGRMTPAGDVTLFPIPNPILNHCYPECYVDGLARGPDGALWLSILQRRIGRLPMGGPLTIFLLPNSQLGAPGGIIRGPDGALWFSELWGARIGRISLTGQVKEFTVSKLFDNVSGLTVGPDRRLWFTLSCQNTIGRMSTSGHVTTFHVPGTPRDAGQDCPGVP